MKHKKIRKNMEAKASGRLTWSSRPQCRRRQPICASEFNLNIHYRKPCRSLPEMARLLWAFSLPWAKHRAHGYTSLFAKSFLGGSRQTRHTRRQACMPWTGWPHSRRNKALFPVSWLTGPQRTKHTWHQSLGAVSPCTRLTAKKTAHVDSLPRHGRRPGPLRLSWAWRLAHGNA
jgi:hypothetical protein